MRNFSLSDKIEVFLLSCKCILSQCCLANISFKVWSSILFSDFGECHQFPGHNPSFCYTARDVSTPYATLCLFVITKSVFLPMRTENTGNYMFCNRDDRELGRGNILMTANTCSEVGDSRVANSTQYQIFYLQSVVHKFLYIAWVKPTEAASS